MVDNLRPEYWYIDTDTGPRARFTAIFSLVMDMWLLILVKEKYTIKLLSSNVCTQNVCILSILALKIFSSFESLWL